MNEKNKELYFDGFSKILKSLKDGLNLNSVNLDDFITGINEYSDINLQDIITYMLYCFELIELTGKWKLKKLIKYEHFINNMENIYNEIFCNQESTFNNKVIAATSFGNIIAKTINYNVELEIEKVLDNFINCIDKKNIYLKNNELTLLRGNLYCQIFYVLNDNKDVNDTMKDYLEKLTKIFDHQKYINNANKFYSELLNHEGITFDSLNNLLLYNAYNRIDIDKITTKKILKILLNNYKDSFFDKEIFIYLIRNIISTLLEEKNIQANIEILFDDVDSTNNYIYLNYNKIDYNLNNNLNFIKKLFYDINMMDYRLNKEKYQYLNLLEIKDNYIKNKLDSNDTVINFENTIKFISIEEFNKFIKEIDELAYKNMLNITLENVKKLYDTLTNKEYDDIKVTNTELFNECYNSLEIKALLDESELLKIEYNDLGVYKNIKDLLMEKYDNQNGENKLDNNLYKNIINSRDTSISSLLNDYYSLLLIDTTDTGIIKEKENILKSILPDLLKEKILFCGNIPTQKFDEIYNEYINPCIKKISQNRVNNKEFADTKEFLNYEKSNSDNYFGICKLQEILEQYKEN